MESKLINPVEEVIKEMEKHVPLPINEMNKWLMGSEEPTKQAITEKANVIMSMEDALKTFLEVKFMENVISEIVSNKEYRKRVKEEFLKETGGEVKKHEMFGIEIAPVSQVKKNMFSKVYVYSEQVDKMEKEIEEILSDLDLKKQALKLLKTIEINNGTAKEVTVDNLFSDSPEVQETDPLKDFDLKITFKNKQ